MWSGCGYTKRLIPFLQIPPLQLLGLKFHPFGMLVALGFIVGSKMAAMYAQKHKLRPEVIQDSSTLCLVFGFLGAHLFHVMAYEPSSIFSNPIRFLQVWSGLSSYGGFMGATTALVVYFRKKKIQFLPYTDALIFGLLVGWIFGRIGCFTAHDHPGKLSDFFLAVQYPGGSRHDLGLYECLLTIGLLGIFCALWKLGFDRTNGFLCYVTSGLYALVRFFLDFLRANDAYHAEKRYFSLTPAQYLSLLVLVSMCFMAWRSWKAESKR